MKVLVLASLSLGLLACADDAPAGPDAMEVPIDAAADYQLTGEYVDWTSTTSQFDGVESATWMVRGEPTRTAMTAPNGRILIMVPGRPVTIDVRQTRPAPNGPYLDAMFVADPAVLATAGAGFSARGLKSDDAASFYQSLGLTFDPAAAHVLVEKQGAGVPLTLTGATVSFVSDGVDDTTWVAGDTGRFVLFANVPVGGGTGTLRATGGFTGPTTLPLEVGRLTITSIR